MPYSPERLTKTDYESLAEFRYALRKFLGFSENAASTHGVSPHQYQALLAIQGYPNRDWVTMAELAEQMQIAHHSAVGLVDRMMALGLVIRKPSTEDRRSVLVLLTAKGLKLLEKLHQAHRIELNSSGPKLAASLLKTWSRVPTKSDAKEAQVFSSPACSMPEIED